MIKHIIT